MRTASTLILLAALAMPTRAADKPPAGKLELPPPASVEYRPGKLIRVEAKGAAKVAWEVLTVPPVELDFAEKGTALLLPMPPPGTSVWIFAAAAGDNPSIAKTSIAVKGQVQAPAPPRPKVGRVRHLTFVADGFDLAEAPELLKGAADRGVKVQAITWKQAVELGFEDPRKEPHGHIVLQAADGEVLSKDSGLPVPAGPGAVAEVLAAIDRVNAEK